MRERSQAASILLLAMVGCASKPTNSEPTTWYPIPGASVAPWEQTQAACGPILQQGAIAAIGGAGAFAVANAKAQYRACMGQYGWTDQAPKDRNDARSAALDQDAEELRTKIEESRTKNALTLLVGESPTCQPGDPGTEICGWHWTRHAASESIPLQMTCILPQDGSPRKDASCRFGRDDRAR
jgi:hypothetical protein